VDSKARIRKLATRLFARQGFAGVSLRSIAEGVGITKPSLLYHFPSKDHLREEVLSEVFDHWARRLPSLVRAVTSGSGTSDALMNELVAFFREDTDRAHLLLREIVDRPDEMRRRIGESLQPLVVLVADTIRKGQALNVVQADVDPEAFVCNMIGLTIVLMVAAPVVEPVVRSDGETATDRLQRELYRIATTSLFCAPPRPVKTRRQSEESAEPDSPTASNQG
jgi:TetR/AcrR family transcriptional regulator